MFHVRGMPSYCLPTLIIMRRKRVNCLGDMPSVNHLLTHTLSLSYQLISITWWSILIYLCPYPQTDSSQWTPKTVWRQTFIIVDFWTDTIFARVSTKCFLCIARIECSPGLETRWCFGIMHHNKIVNYWNSELITKLSCITVSIVWFHPSSSPWLKVRKKEVLCCQSIKPIKTLTVLAYQEWSSVWSTYSENGLCHLFNEKACERMF